MEEPAALDASPGHAPPAYAPVGLGDTQATRRHRSAAAAACVSLAILAALAALFGLRQGPEIRLIVPIAAAVWSLADLLTAALLIAQFYFNGRRSFAILSVAYATSGFLTWPFLLAFPGMLQTPAIGLGSGREDFYVYLWMSWHCSFPVLVFLSTLSDSPRKRITSRRAIGNLTILTAATPLILAGGVVAALFAARNVLPHLVIGGHLQPLDRLVFHPAIISLNAAVGVALLRRRARMTTLQLWLCVAMFSACLDSLLVDLSAATYSYAWDIGKFVAVATACIVLVTILFELVMLYGRQLRLNETLARDLTLREHSEAVLTQHVADRREALRESERQYHSLAEALPHIVWTAGPDGALDYFNQRCFAYSGATFDELQGAGWLSILHPSDVENSTATWSRCVAEGTSYEIEFRLRRGSDGAYRWHLGAALPIRDAGGAIAKWFGTCTDIDDQRSASEAAGRLDEQMRLNETLERDLTARKRAEAALRASDELFQQVEAHSPIGLALVALDGRFIRVNPALCAITQLHEDELLATTFQQLTHPGDLAADLENIERTLAGELANFALEMRYVLTSGNIVWVLLNCSLVRDDAAQPSYFIRQIQDISARKAVERELQIAEKSALAATESKSRFLATMSHELRTPMNGIIGMTELLALSNLDADQSEHVRVVRESGTSLLRVLNDILDYSKIEAGKLDLELLDFDLPSHIESVVSLLRPQFEMKGVALDADVPVHGSVPLAGDPGRVRQILFNLLGNALKFTPPSGCVRLTVTHEPWLDNRFAVRFRVDDTGVGIPVESQHRLFQPFSQVDGSTTRTYGGTGLGLSICKQLVELMGGEIGVDSAPHRGSSFWFTIPFARSNPLPRASKAPAATKSARDEVQRRTEKLLLAEDNDVNTIVAISQFKRLGFAVTTVANGRQAVDMCRSHRFELIFMDCHMPEMDGLEATQAIRELEGGGDNRVPIVAMTANAQAEDRKACLSAGMDDYLSKPVSLSDLESLLERWLPTVDKRVAATVPERSEP